ncbi:MAG: radical SAM protein [Mariprofundaceae bacterium]|nr:radical SAM protein [Mariprofundaceae bacterium]
MPVSDTSPVRVYEIYDSIQGESTLAGMPCTLVRLAGCPLRCNYCDTPQALPFDSGQEYSIEQVTDEIRQRNRPLTLVSGGEPLAQKSCLALLSALAEISPILQLETSGAFNISQTDSRVRRILDIKTPGSGENKRNHWENLNFLKDGDEIKVVITSHDDYMWAVTILRKYQPVVPVLFSPAWGDIQPSDLALWILEDHVPARMQLQLHKHIWGAETTGV